MKKERIIKFGIWNKKSKRWIKSQTMKINKFIEQVINKDAYGKSFVFVPHITVWDFLFRKERMEEYRKAQFNAGYAHGRLDQTREITLELNALIDEMEE